MPSPGDGWWIRAVAFAAMVVAGRIGIFTPMCFIHARKPDQSQCLTDFRREGAKMS